jgi:kynurenine formamidase
VLIDFLGYHIANDPPAFANMIESIDINGHTYRIVPGSGPIDISIPLQFNGTQPNAFGVPPATSEACVSGDLVGDTRRGGSCNFESYTLIPHCNGTHTECVGHITNERISVRDCLRDVLVNCAVISVAGEPGDTTGEGYSMPFASADTVITRRGLEAALKGSSAPEAVVVRTRPNDESKLSRRYVDEIPPYFTSEAMRWLVEQGVRHLLVDLPSIDRLYDEGRLSNHRVFWNVDPGSFETSPKTRTNATITELIYVPDSVEDGPFLLNLQIAPFATDASPSRPLLFRLA